jgi:hypothetical protein
LLTGGLRLRRNSGGAQFAGAAAAGTEFDAHEESAFLLLGGIEDGFERSSSFGSASESGVVSAQTKLALSFGARGGSGIRCVRRRPRRRLGIEMTMRLPSNDHRRNRVLED